MAGSSGTGSLLHNFHQGRDGGSTSGWKFQTASALKSRCSKNWLRSALACWAIFVSRSYGSLSKNSPRLTSALVATSVSRTTLLSGVGIYPTPLDTTITIAASSAWTRRTNGT